MDSEFQRRSDAFLKWLLDDVTAKISPNVKLIDLREQGAGRGLGKTANILWYLTMPKSQANVGK